MYWIIAAIGILLTSSAFSQTNEVLSFKHNTTINFSTTKHPKALGLNITLRYPVSWNAREGNRPNVVQNFRNTSNDGFAGCSLLIIASPEIISKADALAAVEAKTLRKSVPSNAIFIFSKTTKLDGLPAGILAYKLTQQYAGLELTSYFQDYITFYDNKLIQLTCSVGDQSDSRELSDRFEAYSQSVFLLIAGSMVVQNQWGAR